MELYSLLYPLTGIIGVFFGIYIFNRYRNTSSFFMLFFTIGFFLWYILYFLFFSGITNIDVLLLLSRSAFGIGIISMYALLFFVIFYSSHNKFLFTSRTLSILIVFLVVLYIFIGTNWMIESLEFDPVVGVYREIYGIYYKFTIAGYIVFLLLFTGFSIKQILTLKFLNKARFQYIAISGFIFLFLLILLQAILPLFNIWILEKEIIFLYIFFVMYVAFSIKRYYFSPLYQEYGFLKIFTIVLCIIISIGIVGLIKFLNPLGLSHINGFWYFPDTFDIADSLSVLIVYIISYFFCKRIFLLNDSDQNIKYLIDITKQNISNSTTIEQVDKILQSSVRNIFKTTFSKIAIIHDDHEYGELQKYFSNPLSEKLFINDIVFIEENKTKFDKELLSREIHRDTVLIFPIKNPEGVISGLYFLGKKPLGDFYTINEIQYLLSLVRFLALHLKYLATYKKIQDYSLQLDKRIDDKTIEYNDLINKQKEFISMISHEIRSPIGSTVFQVDAIIDEVHKGKLSMNDVENKIRDLSDQLVRVGELLKKLFSVQYFDTRNVVLLKEKIHIGTLLEKEFDIYSRMHQNIKFIKNIPADVGFASIDKVHFHQVLTNLIDNAMKFADESNPVILIECYLMDNKYICIRIEDNGSGYGSIDPSVIFDKYTTGNHAKLGLGMGLFLCKKIIDMHNGTIVASNGKILSGASFLIKIPI